MPHTPQSDYLPPADALSLYGKARRPSHRPVWGSRVRWAQAATQDQRLRYMIDDWGGASGLQRRDVLDENYE